MWVDFGARIGKLEVREFLWKKILLASNQGRDLLQSWIKETLTNTLWRGKNKLAEKGIN